MGLTPSAYTEALVSCGITHLVHLPCNEHALTLDAIRRENSIKLICVTREGEAIAIAAGLIVGGARPLVMIQNTGMFESGDSIRGFGHLARLPIVMTIGYRDWAPPGTERDPEADVSAGVYTEPFLDAWHVAWRLALSDADLGMLAEMISLAESRRLPTALLLLDQAGG